MLLRANFSKLKPVRYISHLELMDTFRKSFRRAQLPVAFTQGYNPHIKLSLGQPLSVGMIGKSEYFDLNLTKKFDRIILLNQLNKVVPDGINILQARYIPETSKSLQAVVNCAVYDIKLNFNKDKITEKHSKEIVKDFLKKEEIIITRIRRNKSNRELDLRPMIYNIKILESNLWRFTVSTGSRGNVRPEELIKALKNNYSLIEEIPVINFMREGLYVRENQELYPPFSEVIVGR